VRAFERCAIQAQLEEQGCKRHDAVRLHDPEAGHKSLTLDKGHQPALSLEKRDKRQRADTWQGKSFHISHSRYAGGFSSTIVVVAVGVGGKPSTIDAW
jgi:hypothetical protein